jgi:hypothetical protein
MEILTVLKAQADLGHLDLCAFGTIEDVLGVDVFAHWLYDPVEGNFVADREVVVSESLPPGVATLTQFETLGDNVFLGVPPTAGRVFALDQDNDDLIYGAELLAATDPDDPDSDDDGFPDGYEVAIGSPPNNPTEPGQLVHVFDSTPPQLLSGYPNLLRTTASTAVYELAFDEPATYKITASDPIYGDAVRERHDPVLRDTIVLQGLRPSSEIMERPPGNVLVPGVLAIYDTLTIEMTDPGGNTGFFSVGGPTTAVHLEPVLKSAPVGPPNIFAAQPLTQIISGLEVVDETPTFANGWLDLEVEVTIEPMHEGDFTLPTSPYPNPPASGKVIVAQVLKKVQGRWTVVSIADIQDHPGPVASSFRETEFHLSGSSGLINEIHYTEDTDNNGQATFAFRITNLTGGEELRLNIVAILVSIAPAQPPIPNFISSSRQTWLMPLTEDDPGGNVTQSLRFATFTFPSS